MQACSSRDRVDGGVNGGRRWHCARALIAGIVLLASVTHAVSAQTSRLRVVHQNLYHGAQPVYLYGQGFWHAVVKDGFDFQKEADWYRPYGANLTRVKTITTRILPSSQYSPLNPWIQLSNGKYDLNSFNEKFWSRLDDFLRKNQQSGRYVLLQIFDQVTMKKGTDQWDRHPLNPNNNVNNLGLPGNGEQGFPDVYDVKNTALMDYYQRYIARLLVSTYQYDHVIYEICNEYSGPLDFLDYVLGLIRTFETSKQIDLLITNMSCSPTLWDYEAKSPDIDLLDFWHAPRSIRYLQIEQIYEYVSSLRAASSKPVFTGRIGLEPDITAATPHFRREARAQLWAVFMAGGVAATTKEDNDGIENGPSVYDLDDKWEAEGFLGLHTVLDNLWHTGVVTPRQDLILSRPFTHVWAVTAGHEILVYLGDTEGPGGGTLTLQNVPAGRYTAKTFAPDPCQVVRVDRVTPSQGQVSIQIDPVTRDDRVVWFTPEPFDVTARWEGQNDLRRILIELRELPAGYLSYSIHLNGQDVSRDILGLFNQHTVLPGNGLSLATPWFKLPSGVYELDVWVHGPSVSDRSVTRLRVE